MCVVRNAERYASKTSFKCGNISINNICVTQPFLETIKNMFNSGGQFFAKKN